MVSRCAVATLLYSTDYLQGVFTLGHQLAKLLRDRRNIETCLVVSRDLWNGALSELSKTLLRLLYSHVVQVDPLRDQELSVERNAENLKLLNRPELSFTLIKARLWELTTFDRVLYLDADTLPLNEQFLDIFDLFPQQTSNQIGGAPDIGWPDMFNSGVLMLTPDKDLASALHQFILDHTSIDGADQGILNQFFNPFCAVTGQEPQEYGWTRLPFIYNVTVPNNGYQSSPATKFFQSQIRLVHFIGENKPWKGWVNDSGNGYATQWNQVYKEFLESYGLIQFFEEMGLQTPAAPEPPQETASPLANWDEFQKRVMEPESEGSASHDTSHSEPPQDNVSPVVDWDNFEKRVMEPEHKSTESYDTNHSEPPQDDASPLVDWDNFQKRVTEPEPAGNEGYSAGKEHGSPVVDWDNFQKRVDQEPDSNESYETGQSQDRGSPVVDWDNFQKRVMQTDPDSNESYETGSLTTEPQETERIFASSYEDTDVVTDELEKLSVTRVWDPRPTAQLAVSSELPVLASADRPEDRTVERVFPSDEPERVFPQLRDLPQFPWPSVVDTPPEEPDQDPPAVPRVDQVLEMIKEESEPDPASRHVFDWEDTDYLQEVERVFPD